MNKLCIYIVVFISVFSYGKATNDSIKIKRDEGPIIIKSFDEGFENRYKSNEYNYDAKTGEAQNLISRFINWITKGISELFGVSISPQALAIIEIIIYVLLGIFALYLLIRFLTNENISSLFNKTAKTIAPIEISEDNITAVDLDEFIKKALLEGNYRLAVRYLYLMSLKKLSLHKLISWHYQKTNTEYANEIDHPEIKNAFQKTSFWYEYVWYGEFYIDEPLFENAQENFKMLEQLINKHFG
ncbi:hypothetical protein [Leptobacterium sp. I13]|uniref:hypothetical protein n=1 Tax=Leptobacterium meishanense TaxID=3128904 RepID=UPI0030ED6E82